jgi:uncharacterized protein (DUF779 family)
MRVTGTPAAADVVDRVRQVRTGTLVFTIGTGCCESTAPFLFEDFWPGPDHETVGEVSGVPVYAPAHLRQLYPGEELLVIDVDDGPPSESFSIETEQGCRFVLRTITNGREATAQALVALRRPRSTADIPATVSALRPLESQVLPEPLQRLRMLQESARQHDVRRSAG